MKEFWRSIAERLTQTLLQLLDRHPGKVIGMLLGFVAGLIVVLLGFWRSVLLALFVLAGFYFGKRHDEHQDFSQFLERFFGNRN